MRLCMRWPWNIEATCPRLGGMTGVTNSLKSRCQLKGFRRLPMDGMGRISISFDRVWFVVIISWQSLSLVKFSMARTENRCDVKKQGLPWGESKHGRVVTGNDGCIHRLSVDPSFTTRLPLIIDPCLSYRRKGCMYAACIKTCTKTQCPTLSISF